MTDEEKLAMLQAMLDGESVAAPVLSAYMTAAKNEILAWRYSYASEYPEAFPREYDQTQVFAVLAGYSQKGAEGETNHSENGISRTFRYADMVSYIRDHVVPICRVG